MKLNLILKENDYHKYLTLNLVSFCFEETLLFLKNMKNIKVLLELSQLAHPTLTPLKLQHY